MSLSQSKATRPEFAARGMWVLAILLLASLWLPRSMQFPANAVLLAAAVFLLAALLVDSFRSGSWRTNHPGLVAGGAFAAWVALDFALHGCRSARPLEWLALLSGLMLFWAGHLSVSQTAGRWPTRYLHALAVLAVVEGLFGVVQALRPDLLPIGMTGFEGARARGTFSNPNQYAGLLAAAFPAALWIALAPGRVPAWHRGLGAAATAAVLAGLAGSGSRGALVGMALAGVAVVGIAGLARRRLWLAAPALLLLLTLAVGAGAAVWSWQRAAARPPTGSAATTLTDKRQRGNLGQTLRELLRDGRLPPDATLRQRVAAASACIRIWADHPWLGVGPGNYVQQVRFYLGPDIDPVFFETGAHSLPFQLLAELGIIGGLLWPAVAIFLGIALYRRFRRAPPGSPEVCVAFCLGWGVLAVWIHNLVDITVLYHPVKYVFPFLAALAVAWPPSVAAPDPNSPPSFRDSETQ